MDYPTLRLLLVDDNDDDTQLAQVLCRKAGLRLAVVRHAQSLAQAVRFITEETFDVTLLDLGLPDSQGAASIQSVLDHDPDTAVIVLTGQDDETLFLQAIRGGAQDYLIKGQTSPLMFRRTIIRAVERQQIIRDLRQKAFVDSLTGLSNRQGFLTLASHQLKLAERAHISAGLIYFDIDNFKQINDRFGHGAGDMALRHVAEKLRTTSRESDLVARLGGDEFVVLATHAGDPDSHRLLQRLQLALAASQSTLGAAGRLRLSYGICRFDPEAPVPLAALLSQADQAMYEMKRRRHARHA